MDYDNNQLKTDPVERSNVIEFTTSKMVNMQRVQPVLQHFEMDEEELPKSINWANWVEVQRTVMLEIIKRYSGK